MGRWDFAFSIGSFDGNEENSLEKICWGLFRIAWNKNESFNGETFPQSEDHFFVYKKKISNQRT